MRVIGNALVGVGSILMLLAAIGVLRLPDVFSRMHAATKSASLGLACILAGTAFLLPAPGAAFKLVVAIMFQLTTAPVAAHVIGRAAYRAGVPLWEGTLYDEMEERVRERREHPPEDPRAPADGMAP
ncbi:MAG: monovalent cation/H(+) antiporter subunit G [Actinomycetota bacterium]|nr:monovalent cation/H(+) antiporter subunit G [Actinomycetota bacterium]